MPAAETLTRTAGRRSRAALRHAEHRGNLGDVEEAVLTVSFPDGPCRTSRMAKTRRFRTKRGFREPSVKALEDLLAGMSTRTSTVSAETKIRDAIKTGGEIDLELAEMKEVVTEIRLRMQNGKVDAEIAGIRHDENT